MINSANGAAIVFSVWVAASFFAAPVLGRALAALGRR